MNLVTNAHQALRKIPPPRRLTFTTWADAGRRQVALQVVDTDPGSPAELQTRIFESFFTTKPVGIGTGLGLSRCRGIIEEHGSTITVCSRPGQGASFLVEVPGRHGAHDCSGTIHNCRAVSYARASHFDCR